MASGDHPASSKVLPLIDLSWMDGDAASRGTFLADLRAAARDVGFFYLAGHGIPDERIEAVVDAARRFFALPDEDKAAIAMVNSPHFRGYTRAGGELTRGRPDRREQIDIGVERPAVPRLPGAPPWAGLVGPNQWPAALPELKPLALAWLADTTAVLRRLLGAFAVALGQPASAFDGIVGTASSDLLKLIRYPGRDASGDEQGVGAHKDGGFLTLLLQPDRGGLQVEDPDGGWIDATPIPGTFVVNIGELLELASDGYLRATVHRVVTPPSGTERFSVASFLRADLDATVPLIDLPLHLAGDRRGVTRDPENPLFRNVGENTLKGRLRSHPDVAARHWADFMEKSQN
jgi:isopenicillin N synthase-like dioxygenase